MSSWQSENVREGSLPSGKVFLYFRIGGALFRKGVMMRIGALSRAGLIQGRVMRTAT
jgi:hypothetical protein